MKDVVFDLKKTLELMRSHETPPPPSGSGLREWFAGIALSNAEFMKDIKPEDRVAAAVKVADDLINALTAPKPLSNTSIKINNIVEQDQSLIEKRERATQPAIRSAKRNSILPPPMDVQRSNLPPFGEISVPGVLTPKPKNDAGRYSVVPSETKNEGLL